MNYRYKMISKILFGLFSIVLLFHVNSVYADEELPIITIDFISGNIIDLDENPQMIRADIQIQNYNPQNGYHFMKIVRSSDGEIIKDTEILPKVIEDDLFGVQILHYLEPDTDESNLMGDYEMRIYSEFGSFETVSTFSVIKSSLPVIVASNSTNSVENMSNSEENEDVAKELSLENPEPESKIPTWVHDIFVWYADETISETELLSAIEYLVSQKILNVDSN